MKGQKGLKMLKNKLRVHCGNGEIVSVYVDAEDPELYRSGFLLAVEGKHFLLAEVAENGRYYGHTVYRTKELFKIEFGGKSEDREHALYSLYEQTHPAVEAGGKSLIADLLEYAKKNRLIVSIVQYGEESGDLCGFVKSVRKGVVELHLVDEYGMRNGVSVCMLDSVTRVYCDGEYEQVRRRLYAYYQEQERRQDEEG